MDIEVDKKTAYDAFPYTSNAFRQTHPAFLKAVASLSGLDTPMVENARILEIGCSFGGNAIPIAQYYPNTEVIGIDLSKKQIEVGQKAIEAMGLKNITLLAQDISTYDVPEDYFDYIICHGVYSWVPDFVKEAIFKVIAKGLNDRGVAFVSYNTYPGWKIYEVYRDAMIYRSQGIEEPNDRLSYSFGMLDFLKENLPKNTPWGLAIEQNYSSIRNHSSYYILHEYLETVNDPCYFYQFMEKAQKNGLTFVAEADYHKRFSTVSAISKEAQEALKKEAGGDIVKLEQLRDYVSSCQFRQTLLTKAKQGINYSDTIMHDTLKKMYVYGGLTKEEKDGKVVWRPNRSGSSESTYNDIPVVQFLAKALNEYRTETVLVADLYKKYQEEVSNASKDDFFMVIATLIVRRDIMVWGTPVCFHLGNTDTPELNETIKRLVKWLVDNPNTISVVNQFHENTEMSNHILLQKVFPYLDGKHDMASLCEKIAEVEAKGELNFSDRNQQKITDKKALEDSIKEHLKELLNRLQLNGFLV